MKKIFFVIIVLMFYNNVLSQNYVSDRRIFNEILKTAESVLDFKEFLDTTENYYYEFEIKLNMLNNKSKIKDYKLVAEYRENFEKEIKIDTALLFKVTDMEFRDQAVREDNIDDKEMIRIDSINHIEIKKIILEKGKLPGVRDLGNDGMLNMGTLLRHIGDSALLNFLYPYMIKAAKEGDFIPDFIAYNIDYCWHANNFIPKDYTKWISYQLYGTLEKRLNKREKIKVPVKDWEETERLRYELGMQSLKEELEENPNIIYDLELFKQKFPEFQY